MNTEIPVLLTDHIGDVDPTPFAEDCIVTGAARLIGHEVFRTQAITITDRKALEEAGLTKKSPDYSRIRELLNSGAIVQGASLGPVEYILRRPSVKDNGHDAAQRGADIPPAKYDALVKALEACKEAK